MLSFVSIIIAPQVDARQISHFKSFRKTIVIDPGHGGHDLGAKGPQGSFEKDITLSLAQKLKSELDLRYNVVLTRKNDYGLDLFARTAVANQHKADLFISLHLAGGWRQGHTENGIYTYKEPGLSESNVTGDSVKPEVQGREWNDIQFKHIAKSQIMAAMLQKQFPDAIMRKLPMVVLCGADMPAVAIEVGCLTNPMEEKKLHDEKEISLIIKAVCYAIDQFFDQNLK